uniref:DDT domain-containing protein n=1 Tax=Leersia perrieri TaxID=77586 RepID=A0A0D9WWH6_9ORYZ
MAASPSSSPPASPSHPNPSPPPHADPRSTPPMPSPAADGDAPSSSSPPEEEGEEEKREEEEEEAPAPAPVVVVAAEEAPTPRKMRLPRACNSKPKPPPPPPPERPRRRAAAAAAGGGGGGAGEEPPQCRVVTPLVSEPEAPAELPRWRLRCMWELASVLNFLHVFRPLLNISEDFTAEELEEALITPNSTLDDVHMPLLKSIPPVTRMAMGRGTWVTVLCRKLRDWWHWQEDIRNFIDSSLKHGYDLSTFRKERIGGDPYGISYWYEDDPILGHRLYREIRRVEQVKKEPGKRSRGKRAVTPPVVSYQWETVASNFDEFDDVAEKLFSSRNRSEANLGKKLKIEYLPDIEKIHKKKERMLKKQQREALLIDSYLAPDGFTTGRSLRDRKPVTYTFDEYDRSITEAIKITKKGENSAEPVGPANRRILTPRPEASSNGKVNGLSPTADEDGNSSKSDDYRDSDGEQESEALDRSNRRRTRSQRYTRDFVEAVSDIDPNFDSDDEIMGEAVYDDEYLRTRKQQKTSSASEEDEEFRLEEDAEDDDDEEEEEYSLSTSEDLEEPQRHKKLQTRGRRGAKLRSVDEIQTGLRRSKRSSRQRINYQQYDYSDTDTEAGKEGKSDASDPDAGFDAENDTELSTSSQEQEEEDEDDGPEEQQDNSDDNKMEEDHVMVANKEQQEEQPQSPVPPPQQPVEKMEVPSREIETVGRTFLDLNELAPGGGFDDGPSLTMKDEDMDNS